MMAGKVVDRHARRREVMRKEAKKSRLRKGDMKRGKEGKEVQE